MTNKRLNTLWTLFLISLGTAIYAFGLVAINIPNNLAEGGLTGITLILRHWFAIDPAYSTIFLNIPLILIGFRFLGKRPLFYTIWGTLSLSVFIFLWQRIPIISQINLDHDLFISALLAGLIGGFGSGIVFKAGGTTGGTDIVARIFEKEFNVPMGKSVFAIDFLVLTASLSYIDIKHMMYTLVASFVFSRVVTMTGSGAYTEKGLLIISDKPEAIGNLIKLKLDRGFTYLNAAGGYKETDKRVIYCVISQQELPTFKDLIKAEDENAFVSILDVQEVYGDGFSFNVPATKAK